MRYGTSNSQLSGPPLPGTRCQSHKWCRRRVLFAVGGGRCGAGPKRAVSVSSPGVRTGARALTPCDVGIAPICVAVIADSATLTGAPVHVRTAPMKREGGRTSSSSRRERCVGQLVHPDRAGGHRGKCSSVRAAIGHGDQGLSAARGARIGCRSTRATPVPLRGRGRSRERPLATPRDHTAPEAAAQSFCIGDVFVRRPRSTVPTPIHAAGSPARSVRRAGTATSGIGQPPRYDAQPKRLLRRSNSR